VDGVIFGRRDGLAIQSVGGGGYDVVGLAIGGGLGAVLVVEEDQVAVAQAYLADLEFLDIDKQFPVTGGGVGHGNGLGDDGVRQLLDKLLSEFGEGGAAIDVDALHAIWPSEAEQHVVAIGRCGW